MRIFGETLKFASTEHFGRFWQFLSINHLRQNSIVGTREYKIGKNKGTLVITTFKIDSMKVPLFFLMFGLLVPKIEICLKYFLDKKFQKQPLCDGDR